MKPNISVIIPTYNRKDFLLTTVESVINQTFHDFELLIIDDGSTDNTRDFISQYNDSRIRYYYLKKNKGPSFARNFGIKKSRADFIAFLDSDDRWKKDKLKIQYNAMISNSRFLLSHTEEIWYKNGKILNPKKIHKKRGGDIFEQSLKLCSISMSTVMAHKDIFNKVGLFDENLIVCEDYDMWLRVTSRYSILLISDYLTLKEGGHTDQLSHRFIGMDKFRIYSIQKLIENEKLSKDKLHLAIKELIHKSTIYGNGCIKHNKKEEGEYYLQLAEQYKNYEK